MNENNEIQYETVEVAHDEFRRGLPHGRYHVIVNPALAQKYMQQRLWLKTLMLPTIGIGVVLSLSGYFFAGLVFVVIGVLAPRLIRKKAPELLLHLAMRDKDIYQEAIEHEILEVRIRGRK